MPVKVAHWFESLSNAVTDGKVAEILRTKIDLIETQRDDALLRANKAEARILILEDENKQLQRELADFRKADREKNDFHGLSEEAVKVLQWIGRNRSRGSHYLQQALSIEDAKLDYLTSVLSRRDLISWGSSHPSDGTHFYATDAGLDYLAKHNML